MDEHDIAADLREAVLGYAPFASSQVREPFGSEAGFILEYPDGRYLVTVVQIGE